MQHYNMMYGVKKSATTTKVSTNNIKCNYFANFDLKGLIKETEHKKRHREKREHKIHKLFIIIIWYNQ